MPDGAPDSLCQRFVIRFGKRLLQGGNGFFPADPAQGASSVFRRERRARLVLQQCRKRSDRPAVTNMAQRLRR